MYTLTASEAHRMSRKWEQQLQRLAGFMESLGASSGGVQELIEKVIAFRDTHPIHLDKPALDVIDCEELIELGFLVESTITKELGIDFIDRDEEVKKLITLEGGHDSPFWLVDAPARYGKTFFLFKARKELRERGNWQICYFSFKEYPESARDRKRFLRDFRRTFDKTFKEPWPDPTVEQLQERLVADLGSSPAWLAVQIDDAELVEEKEIVDWIKKVLDEVWKARKGRRFLGLVSGRYISPKWYEDLQVYPLFDKKITIGSLGIQYTQEMIEKICDRFHIAMPGDNMESRQAARMIQMIGAGCPECTINLLIDIGRDTVFNPSGSFFSPERRAQLFNQHVAPICDEVLADIDDLFTRKYFPYLCILRRYNDDLLPQLLRFLQTDLFQEPVDETGPGRMDTVINRSGLVMPDIKLAFKGDNNIRQLFGLQKWLFDKDAQRVNDWAMRYFEKQITQKKGSNGIWYNREAFVEFMYHYVLHLRSRKPTRDEACQAFTSTLAKAARRLEAFSPRQGLAPAEWGRHKADLGRDLKKDVEIRDQMAHLGVSGPEYAQLCNLP